LFVVGFVHEDRAVAVVHAEIAGGSKECPIGVPTKRFVVRDSELRAQSVTRSKAQQKNNAHTS